MNMSVLLGCAADAAEGGESETAPVFQAVAERPVEADMGEPDQRDENSERLRERDAGRGEQKRPDGRMQRVVSGRADARAGEISGEAQIGHQEQRREQLPVAARAPIERRGAAEQRQALRAQQPAYPALNRSCIGSVVRHAPCLIKFEAEIGFGQPKRELPKFVSSLCNYVWCAQSCLRSTSKPDRTATLL